MREQLTKFGRTDVRHGRSNVPGTQIRKSSSEIASLASLPPLSTRELNRETQCMVLQFSTAQVAEEQGSCMRAVEDQKNGESGISTVKLINWARRNGRVRAEVARLIGLNGRVTDPDFMEGLTKIFDSIVREEALTHSEAQAMGSPLASSPPYDAKAAGEEIDNLTGDLFGGVH